jgi:hypothetical protein
LICTQTKLRAQLLIGLSLNRNLVGHGWLDGLVSKVAPQRKRLKDCRKLRNLFRRRFEFADQCQSLFHSIIESTREVSMLLHSSRRLKPLASSFLPRHSCGGGKTSRRLW